MARGVTDTTANVGEGGQWPVLVMFRQQGAFEGTRQRDYEIEGVVASVYEGSG